MSAALEAWRAGWRPRDHLSRAAWAEKHVRPPGSARSTMVDLSLTPHLRESIEFSERKDVKEMVLVMPTGAGKTTVPDCAIPHTIAEDPRGIILALQTVNDTKEYAEERLMPILRAIPACADILAGMKRDAIRKDAIMIPGSPMYFAGGANKTGLQRRSVGLCIGDEFWRWKHGYGAYLRARLHSRWDGKCIFMSQGGEAQFMGVTGFVDTELEAFWKETDQREWCYECPQCAAVQRYRLKCLRYAPQGERLDLREIAESARYLCAGAMSTPPTCDAVFEGVGNRRDLAASARYVAQSNAGKKGHHGWHCNALGMLHETWEDIAIGHAQAMRALRDGDEMPIKNFRQQRLAENYRAQEKAEETALTVGKIGEGENERDYTFADYADGETWPGEAVRIMSIDVQRDHFWALVRAWKADGSSRRLWCGRINTMGAVQEKQASYKVKPANVYIDSKYDTDTIYNACAANGWYAMQGAGAESFFFPKQNRRKFYSPISRVTPTGGKAAGLIFWAVKPVKRILEKMRGGYRAHWEVEGNMDPEHRAQLFSEIEKDVVNKITKAITRLFVKIRRDNHLFDCEGMNITGALIAGMLSDQPDATERNNENTPSTIEDSDEKPSAA